MTEEWNTLDNRLHVTVLKTTEMEYLGVKILLGEGSIGFLSTPDAPSVIWQIQVDGWQWMARIAAANQKARVTEAVVKLLSKMVKAGAGTDLGEILARPAPIFTEPLQFGADKNNALVKVFSSAARKEFVRDQISLETLTLCLTSLSNLLSSILVPYEKTRRLIGELTQTSPGIFDLCRSLLKAPMLDLVGSRYIQSVMLFVQSLPGFHDEKDAESRGLPLSSYLWETVLETQHLSSFASAQDASAWTAICRFLLEHNDIVMTESLLPDSSKLLAVAEWSLQVLYCRHAELTSKGIQDITQLLAKPLNLLVSKKNRDRMQALFSAQTDTATGETILDHLLKLSFLEDASSGLLDLIRAVLEAFPALNLHPLWLSRYVNKDMHAFLLAMTEIRPGIVLALPSPIILTACRENISLALSLLKQPVMFGSHVDALRRDADFWAHLAQSDCCKALLVFAADMEALLNDVRGGSLSLSHAPSLPFETLFRGAASSVESMEAVSGCFSALLLCINTGLLVSTGSFDEAKIVEIIPEVVDGKLLALVLPAYKAVQVGLLFGKKADWDVGLLAQLLSMLPAQLQAHPKQQEIDEHLQKQLSELIDCCRPLVEALISCKIKEDVPELQSLMDGVSWEVAEFGHGAPSASVSLLLTVTLRRCHNQDAAENGVKAILASILCKFDSEEEDATLACLLDACTDLINANPSTANSFAAHFPSLLNLAERLQTASNQSIAAFLRLLSILFLERLSQSLLTANREETPLQLITLLMKLSPIGEYNFEEIESEEQVNLRILWVRCWTVLADYCGSSLLADAYLTDHVIPHALQWLSSILTGDLRQQPLQNPLLQPLTQLLSLVAGGKGRSALTVKKAMYPDDVDDFETPLGLAWDLQGVLAKQTTAKYSTQGQIGYFP